MPSRNGSKHQLIRRLREISKSHRNSAKQDFRNRRITPKKEVWIRSFYSAAAAQHIQAANLIDEAIRDFPISFPVDAPKGGKR